MFGWRKGKGEIVWFYYVKNRKFLRNKNINLLTLRMEWNVFWSYSICITPSHPQGPILPLHFYRINFVFPFSFFFYTNINAHIPIYAAHILLDKGPSFLWSMSNLSWAAFLKKSFSSTEAVHSSSVRDGNSWAASHTMIEGWLIWYGGGGVQANTAALSSWVNSPVMPRRIFHTSLSHSLALPMIMHSLSL